MSDRRKRNISRERNISRCSVLSRLAQVHLEKLPLKQSVCVCVLQAICTEAGLLALRERRMKVTNEDFKKAKENVLYRKNEGTPDGLYL